MELSREVPIGLVGRDEGGEGESAREGEEEGDLAYSPDL